MSHYRCDVLKESLPTGLRSVDDLGEARLFVFAGPYRQFALGENLWPIALDVTRLVGLLLSCCGEPGGVTAFRVRIRQREMAVRSALGAGR